MTSRLSDSASVDVPELIKRLSRLTPEQSRRWQGLPVHCLDTPEGVWHHKFTPQCTALSLLDEGSIHANINFLRRSTEYDLRAGSMALFNAGLEVRADQRDSRHARRIVLEIDLPLLGRRGLLDDDLPRTPLRDGCEFDDPALAAVLREMVREIDAGCPSGALFAESLSIGVVLHLCRTRGKRPMPASRETGRLSASQWALVNEMIVAEMSSDLSLLALANAVGLSKPHFVRLFRRTAGTSPHRYVTQRRVERARELIVASKVPLVDVAAEAGLSSQSHLNHLFQRIYGMTPGDVRRLSGRSAFDAEL
jgi:AraC family transcriptional regulator